MSWQIYTVYGFNQLINTMSHRESTDHEHIPLPHRILNIINSTIYIQAVCYNHIYSDPLHRDALMVLNKHSEVELPLQRDQQTNQQSQINRTREGLLSNHKNRIIEYHWLSPTPHSPSHSDALLISYNPYQTMTVHFLRH